MINLSCNLNILQATYMLPTNTHSILKDYEYYDLSVEEAEIFHRFYGVSELPTDPRGDLYDLLYQVFEEFFKKYTINKVQIKYLIYAHTNNLVAHFGHTILQDLCYKFSMEAIHCFGTTMNNCASLFNAFDMASNLLMCGGQNDHALILVGEKTYTRSARLIPNTAVLSEGAAIALVTTSQCRHSLQHMALHTEGAYFEGIWMQDLKRKEFEMIYLEKMSMVILEACRSANISLSEVKWIIPHNVNILSWRQLAQYLNYPIEKIYLNNIARTAHCFGADILINWCDLVEMNYLQPGDYYILATSGLGATFAACLCRC